MQAPEGWKLVPIVQNGKAGLTDTMMRRFYDAFDSVENSRKGDFERLNAAYNALLAAAPVPFGTPMELGPVPVTWQDETMQVTATREPKEGDIINVPLDAPIPAGATFHIEGNPPRAVVHDVPNAPAQRLRPDSILLQGDSVVTVEERRAQWDEYLAALHARPATGGDDKAMREATPVAIVRDNPDDYGTIIDTIDGAPTLPVGTKLFLSAVPAAQVDAEDAALTEVVAERVRQDNEPREFQPWFTDPARLLLPIRQATWNGQETKKVRGALIRCAALALRGIAAIDAARQEPKT